MKMKDLEYFRHGINETFTYYNVTTTDGDCFCVSGADLTDVSKEDDVKDYCFDFFDEESYFAFIKNDLVKHSNANKYLVFAVGYGWRNRNGYKFADSVLDALSVDYDNEFYIVGASRGEKSILLKEYSHDNPMGCHWLIVSLTETEFDKLSWSEWDEIEKFAKAQLKKIVTENKKEKTKMALGFES